MIRNFVEVYNDEKNIFFREVRINFRTNLTQGIPQVLRMVPNSLPQISSRWNESPTSPVQWRHFTFDVEIFQFPNHVFTGRCYNLKEQSSWNL